MDSEIIQGSSQQMQWQRMRGANRGLEADHLTIYQKKIYLAAYAPRTWDDDWSLYAFVDGTEQFRGRATNLLHGIERLEGWLEAYARSVRDDRASAERQTKGGNDGQ